MFTKQAELDSVRTLDGMADDKYADRSEESVAVNDDEENAPAVAEVPSDVIDEVELEEADEEADEEAAEVVEV